MFFVGLTGGIASGKSTVTKLFIDNNVPVIDADTIARQGKKIKIDKLILMYIFYINLYFFFVTLE